MEVTTWTSGCLPCLERVRPPDARGGEARARRVRERGAPSPRSGRRTGSRPRPTSTPPCRAARRVPRSCSRRTARSHASPAAGRGHHHRLDLRARRVARVPHAASCCARWARPRAPREPAAQARAFAAAAQPSVPRPAAIEPPGRIEGGDVVWLDDRDGRRGPRLPHQRRGHPPVRRAPGPHVDDRSRCRCRTGGARRRDAPDVALQPGGPRPRRRVLAAPAGPVPRAASRSAASRCVEIPDDEFDSMGTNVLALAPRHCVMLAGNPRTRARARARRRHRGRVRRQRDQREGLRRAHLPHAPAGPRALTPRRTMRCTVCLAAAAIHQTRRDSLIDDHPFRSRARRRRHGLADRRPLRQRRRAVAAARRHRRRRRRRGSSGRAALKPDPFFPPDGWTLVDDRARSTTGCRGSARPTGSSRRRRAARRQARRCSARWTPPGARAASSAPTRRAFPIAVLAEGRSDDFRRHWLGTHFFNPPRYLRLLEVIPTPTPIPPCVDRRGARSPIGTWARAWWWPRTRRTSSATTSRSSTWCAPWRWWPRARTRSRRSTRSPGPPIGRPKSATFRTLDLAGIDILAHVVAQPRASG